MTNDQIEARTLDDGDLEGFARRIANNAIQSAEISDKAAVYCGQLFREHIVAEAKLILQAVVAHERSMARARVRARSRVANGPGF